MTKEFKDAIPRLNIEVLPGGLIRLENETMGDNDTVDLHVCCKSPNGLHTVSHAAIPSGCFLFALD